LTSCPKASFTGRIKKGKWKSINLKIFMIEERDAEVNMVNN
jgi:hypothetical protein